MTWLAQNKLIACPLSEYQCLPVHETVHIDILENHHPHKPGWELWKMICKECCVSVQHLHLRKGWGGGSALDWRKPCKIERQYDTSPFKKRRAFPIWHSVMRSKAAWDGRYEREDCATHLCMNIFSLPLLPGNSARATSIMNPLPNDKVWRHSAENTQAHGNEISNVI